MNKTSFFLSLLIFLYFPCLLSAHQVFASEYSYYTKDIFHIVYSTSGPDMVHGSDSNENGTPDCVENIAIQLQAMRKLCLRLGFPDPLNAGRYKKLTGVMVHILSTKNLQTKKDKNPPHGRAFSRPTKSKHAEGIWLKLHIASTIDPKNNATPAHEYFHLIQYSQSHCMQPWYLEGMARWSEDMIRKKIRTTKKSFILTGDQLFTLSYKSAQILWNPLSTQCADFAKIPEDIFADNFYTDGSPVFEDAYFHDARSIRAVLLCMYEKEKKESLCRNKTPDKDNALIFDCIHEAQSMCKSNFAKKNEQ